MLLEKKLGALADTLEKKEAQLNEVLTASNLDPSALSVVTRKLEVRNLFSQDTKGFILFFLTFRTSSILRIAQLKICNMNLHVYAKHIMIFYVHMKQNYVNSEYQWKKWDLNHLKGFYFSIDFIFQC